MTWKADQENAGRLMTAGVREQPEVLVFREQDARFGASETENCGILCARADFRHRGDVVTCGAESRDDRETTALVGEEAHRLERRTV